MQDLQIQLLGRFHLCYNGEPVATLHQQRLQSVLAFLALHRDTPLTNQYLAAIFGSQASEQVDHAKLDQLHQELIQLLPVAEHFLLCTPESWQWQPDLQIHVDVAAFEQALAELQPTGDLTQLRANYEEAVNLYRGELLPACQEPWILAPRERLHRQWLESVRQLADLLERQGDYLAAIAYTRRLCQHDPLMETELQRLIHLHVLHGDRAGALQALQRRLEAAVRGRGGLVLIEGPAGIGKSSLALACQQPAQTLGVVFGVGYCYERGVLPPFLPWQEVLAALQPALDLEFGSLPKPFGNAPTVQSAHELMRAIVAWLRSASADQPLVLLLEDLHWADAESLDLLDFVTRQLADVPALIIATYRSEEIHRDRPLYDLLPGLRRNRFVDVIRLALLSVDDTARLVEAYHGPCSPSLAGYLQERSEGHPLFLVELLNDLVDQRLLTQDTAGRWSAPAQPVPLPPLLQQVITGRVARLGEEVEAFLEVAAIVGERWDLAVVEGVLAWPEETLLTVLDQVLAAHIVAVVDERREQYRFTHGLIREILYHRQVGRRRKNLHAHIATLLEGRILPDADRAAMTHDDPIAELAYHFYAAEQWDKALHYNRKAGDAAGQRYAAHSTLRFYEQAIDAAHRGSMEVGSDVLLVLYERLGEVHTTLNHKEQAEVAFTHMLEAARSAGDSRVESRALCQLSIIQGWLNRLELARSTGKTALLMAEQTADAHVLALTHFNLGHLDILTGDLAHAHQHLEQATHFARTANSHSVLARSLQNQAYAATFLSRYVEAEEFASAAVEAAKTSRDALAVSGAYFALGHAQVEFGHYAEARRTLQAGVAHAEESGESHYLPKLLNTMGFLYNELGDGELALSWDQRALDACRRADIDRNWEAECYTLLNLATDHLLTGHIAVATTYRHEVEAILDRAQMSRYRFLNRYHLVCAELALAQGDPDRALQSTAEAASLAQAVGVPKNVAKSLLCEGQALLRLGRPHEAAQRLEQALTLADSMGHGSLRWKTRVRLAEVHALLGRANDELLGKALEIVNRIAEKLDAEPLRATFLASPPVLELRINARSAISSAETPPLEPAPSSEFPAGEFPANLTAREVEVVRLVAQGATNRQIAETLLISVKTVNAHMTNILNKTGCDNRTAATTFAVQHGLLE